MAWIPNDSIRVSTHTTWENKILNMTIWIALLAHSICTIPTNLHMDTTQPPESCAKHWRNFQRNIYNNVVYNILDGKGTNLQKWHHQFINLPQKAFTTTAWQSYQKMMISRIQHIIIITTMPSDMYQNL